MRRSFCSCICRSLRRLISYIWLRSRTRFRLCLSLGLGLSLCITRILGNGLCLRLPLILTWALTWALTWILTLRRLPLRTLALLTKTSELI